MTLASTTQPLRLYTFSISHFSEKIRWTLGLEGIPFVEVPWTPPFHVRSARRRGGRTTVPVIEAGREHVQDSTRILHWLDAHRGPLSLLPTDAEARREALDIEARFDEVGSHVIRLAYDYLLPDTESVVRFWTIDATPMQRRALRVAFPLVRPLFRRRLDTRPEQMARSRERLDAGVTFVEERTARGRYLVGDRLSIADVTAAALLSPVACPDEHPVYGSARYRAIVAPLVARWAERPALAWVRAMYRDHRGVFPRAEAVRAAMA